MTATVRPYQLCVFGATGFAGRLVCEHLATSYPNVVRLAISGRDRKKLETMKEEMMKLSPSWSEVDVVVADSNDPVSIDAMTTSTDVLISCAGPYRRYSDIVVASSVKNKTHYLDLTAEIPWVQNNIKKFHEKALADKTKIVHFCGFDSVPMDLGTLLVVDTIRKQYNTGCRLVEQYFVNGYGGTSGGTAASFFDIVSSPEQDVMADPKCLCPKNVNVRSGEKFPGVQYNDDLKSYMIPLAFAKANIPAVYRSSALAKTPYGKNFTYCEGSKADSFLSSLLIRSFASFIDVVSQNSILRSPLKLIAPKSGAGPDLATQRKLGFWRLLFVGYPETSGTSKEAVYLKMEDNAGDPGYWSTTKMLLECALCLILQPEDVTNSAALEGGVLTPALAFGMVALDRLRTRGFVIKTVTSP